MKLKFWKPTLTGIAKATIHRSGKLGFSRAAISLMKLNEKSHIKLATNEESKNDTNLYLLVANNIDEESLKVNKAGQYYYINTKDFFNLIGLNYIKMKIIFDIVEMNDHDQKLYKLVRREKDRKK